MVKIIEKFGEYKIVVENELVLLPFESSDDGMARAILYNGDKIVRQRLFYGVFTKNDALEAARKLMVHENAYTLTELLNNSVSFVRGNETDIEIKNEESGESFYFRKYNKESRYYKWHQKKPERWMEGRTWAV